MVLLPLWTGHLAKMTYEVTHSIQSLMRHQSDIFPVIVVYSNTTKTRGYLTKKRKKKGRIFQRCVVLNKTVNCTIGYQFVCMKKKMQRRKKMRRRKITKSNKKTRSFSRGNMQKQIPVKRTISEVGHTMGPVTIEKKFLADFLESPYGSYFHQFLLHSFARYNVCTKKV